MLNPHKVVEVGMGILEQNGRTECITVYVLKKGSSANTRTNGIKTVIKS